MNIEPSELYLKDKADKDKKTKLTKKISCCGKYCYNGTPTKYWEDKDDGVRFTNYSKGYYMICKYFDYANCRCLADEQHRNPVDLMEYKQEEVKAEGKGFKRLFARKSDIKTEIKTVLIPCQFRHDFYSKTDTPPWRAIL